MKFTGRYCPIENGYSLDEKIEDVAKLTDKFIIDLIEEVGIQDYQKIAEMIIETHIKSMKNEVFIKTERAEKYASHQFYLGSTNKNFVLFKYWKHKLSN